MAIINGTPDDDNLVGDSSIFDIVDVISGKGGDDRISGLLGEDFLGHVVVKDGALITINNNEPGDDVLLGGPGIDSIGGGSGNDQIKGGTGSDLLGATRLTANSLQVQTFDDGNDVIDGEADDDFMSGGAGQDQLFGGSGSDMLGQFVFNGSIEASSFGSEDITYRGDERGDDELNGGSGNDFIGGGQGNDVIFGDSGDDTLGDSNFQFSTTMTISGRTSTVTARLSTSDVGDDTIYGGQGDDTVSGGEGNDRILGGTGNDTLGEYSITTDEIDLDLFDSIAGLRVSEFTTSPAKGREDGDDYLDGGAGNDTLTGGKGDDVLLGRRGNDQLVGVSLRRLSKAGRREVDRLSGGLGRDTFILGQDGTVFYSDGKVRTRGTSDYAVIEDFNKRSDRIQLVGDKSNYRIGASPIKTEKGRAIFWTDGQTRPELIAIVQNTSLKNFNRGFTFV
ncbi:MAG: calcium-binding protein [Cyanobacteria bacterium P01_F01_bin.150]